MKSKYRNWTFTLNNYSEEECEQMKCLDNDKIIRVIFGKEVGENGTPHLQGALGFVNAVRLSTLKKINGRAHWENMRGTFSQNQAYCSKENCFYSRGSWEDEQGKRKDIDLVYENHKNGGNIRDLIGKHQLGYQSLRLAEKLTTYTAPRRVPKKVYWFWGPTGTGKTQSAIEYCEEHKLDYWMSMDTLRWFDGYNGQKVAIIDDFRADFCKFHVLLRLLDQYWMMVEIKGGSVPWVPDEIIITSAYRPEDVYQTREDISQLLRRISKVEYFGPGTEVVGNTGTTSVGEPEYSSLQQN